MARTLRPFVRMSVLLPSVLALRADSFPAGSGPGNTAAASSPSQQPPIHVPQPSGRLIVEQSSNAGRRSVDPDEGVDPWHPAARVAGENLVRVYTSAEAYMEYRMCASQLFQPGAWL